MLHQVKVKTTTHKYCPKTSDSCCQYHRDYINQNVYKPGPGIANVIKEIKTIYQDLTKDNGYFVYLMCAGWILILKLLV